MLFLRATELTLFDQITICIYERAFSSLFGYEMFHNYTGRGQEAGTVDIGNVTSV